MFNLKNTMCRTAFFPALLVFCFVTLYPVPEFAQKSQDKDRSSLAYKERKFYLPLFSIYLPDYSYQFQESFRLVQQANAGDAYAQHELGIRYLTGEGFEKDTAKSFYWIKRAAEMNLPVACYNTGIFINNSWGTKWEPFAAYEYFHRAANYGMPDAEYVLGILYTENLIVPKNIDSANYWINKAAGKGFAPAIDAMKKIPQKTTGETASAEQPKTKGKHSKNKTAAAAPTTTAIPQALTFDFINFNADTTSVPSDSLIFYDLVNTANSEFKQNLGFSIFDSLSAQSADSLIQRVTESANSGSPEANTFLGRFYEKGMFYHKNIVKGAAYYIRAYRLESSLAGSFLSKLMKSKEFEVELQRGLAAKDPDAMFTHATLNSMGYSSSITALESVNYLQLAAEKDHIPSLIELGQCYFVGRPVERDTVKAYACWARAAALGSDEAVLRSVMAKLLFKKGCPESVTLDFLHAEDAKGSILAELILAYMYETGGCIPVDTQAAVNLYRKAAYRGSRTAYSSLKRMYDQLRPGDTRFSITDSDQ
jgi:TPR repeat protein